jgi:chromosome segregation ATPase
MQDLVERIRKAKVKVDSAEKEKIVIETKIGGLREELEKLGYKDVRDATKAIDTMEEEISTLEDTLGELLHDFESKYATLLED